MPLVGSGVKAIETDPSKCAEWKLGDRFRLWAGEWFANIKLGFPWASFTRQKNPNLSLLASAANAYAVATPGVATADLIGSLDAGRRHLSVVGDAVTDDGSRLPVGASPS